MAERQITSESIKGKTLTSRHPQSDKAQGLEGQESKPKLKVLLAAPRGFCAGVVRAIDIVERALEKHGAPVYVRHEIVHNKFVVRALERKGACFIQELDEIPNEHRHCPVIFSAHGVPKAIPKQAEALSITWIDATCPLVSKVHREIERYYERQAAVVMIGHQGHPEVIGTMGQLPEGAVVLIETLADVERLDFPPDQALAYVTQTTLSVDDTAQITEALRQKFPHIQGPQAKDICYATTNRQEAVKEIAKHCDRVLIIGAPNSSNSNRLVDVAKQAGVARADLLQRAADLDLDFLKDCKTLGLSSGASAPDTLIEELIALLEEKFDVSLETVETRTENVRFNVPKELREVQVGLPVFQAASAGGNQQENISDG